MLEKNRILYEDNHLIIVNKKVGELVQGDETGDRTLADEVKEYLKVTYNKPVMYTWEFPIVLIGPLPALLYMQRQRRLLSG